MKKRIFALAGALIMMFAMSINVFASQSDNGQHTAGNSPDASLTIGTQTITESSLTEYASQTTVATDVEGASISAVSIDVAKAAVAQTKAVVGDNATIASIVDLVVPQGTGAATFTLNVGQIRANQNVVVLHMKSDGAWEEITPSKVADGSVTFTLSSYSPVAVVIKATAPKTGDIILLVGGIAVVCLAGAAFFGKKAKAN